MGLTLIQRYSSNFAALKQNSVAAAKIDESNIYQPANMDNRPMMWQILDDCLLPGSGLNNIENFKDFFEQVKGGKSGLILSEHYTNLDLPEIIYFLEKQGQKGPEYEWAAEFSKKIVAVAGMKLNESDPVVRAFTEAFTRVVIYPTRSLSKIENDSITEEEKKAEEARARKINFASMRAMDECKKRGEVILVYPAGTRYRPGKPETKRGLREIDSYLRLFDIMILVSNNGNCLRINPENPENMLYDTVENDLVLHTASPVINCKEFRKNVLASLPPDTEDPKQKTVDAFMDMLQKQHDQVEEQRLKMLK